MSTLRRICMSLMILSLAAPAMASPQILLYDNNTDQSSAKAALDSLSLSYTVGNVSTFNAFLVGGSWDLVVVDCPSSTPASWTPLIDYVDGGGKAVMSFWSLDAQPALASAFDVTAGDAFDLPQDVYAWNASHPIFNSPSVVGNLTSWSNRWAYDGNFLTAVDGGQALAGFTASPSAGQAAIVLGNSGRTLYNGFLFDEFDDPDGIPLVANEIAYLLEATPTVPVPGALFLGSLGAGIVTWLRRRRTL